METNKYFINNKTYNEEFIVSPKRKVMDLLKEISKNVCIDICKKYCDDEVCRKCNFMLALNRLLEEIS